jgi:copper chaperone CopZ
MRTDTYTIADIHCGGCEATIRTLIGDIEGVQYVELDHRTNQVIISYDETLLDDNAIREALANSGFPAE